MSLRRHNLSIALFIGLTALLALAVFWPLHRKKAQVAAKARITREELIHSSADQKLQKFNLTGFDEKGNKFWNLRGDVAKIDVGQTVYLDENVTLKVGEGTTIRTDRVQWSQESGKLVTEAAVTVDHENAKVKGMGAVGRLNDHFIQLNRQIEMVVSGATRLTCDGPLKIFYDEDKMIFYRNVKVVDERGTLTAKRMDVLFDPEAKKVRQIVAIGDVMIQRGTDTTRSRRAIYTLATGSVRLEGSPHITLHKESQKFLDAPLRN
ncbi:MAG: LPS export ABC transporter periplasmic protein LptC [Candidatus Omnitrophota bacterium]